MQILPEIRSLEDYEKMSNYVNISKGAPGTTVSNYKVGLYDDLENEIQYGTLYYNGHGLRLVYEDGCSMNTGYNKFSYCTVSNVDFKNHSICVNDDMTFFFSDEDDFNTFYNYIDLFNIRTETFLNAAIDKVNKIFLAN